MIMRTKLLLIITIVAALSVVAEGTKLFGLFAFLANSRSQEQEARLILNGGERRAGTSVNHSWNHCAARTGSSIEVFEGLRTIARVEAT